MPRLTLIAVVTSLVGILVGMTLYGALLDLAHPDWTHLRRALLLLALPGLLGGMASAFFEGKCDLPYVVPVQGGPPKFQAGILADGMYGMIGGFAVFLLIPGNFAASIEFWEFVKIVALAAVGGFGGRALLTKLLGDLLSAKVQALEQRQDAMQLQEQHDAEALRLVQVALQGDQR